MTSRIFTTIPTKETMEDNPKTSPLYQATLRLVSRVAGARESLQHLTHLAATEGRVDIALSLRSIGEALDNGEMETIAVLRGLDKQTGRQPHQSTTNDDVGGGRGPPK